MIRRDQDVGKRFIVTQQDVEARAQPFDQVRFEEQRLGFGAGDDELKRAGRADHALDAGVEAGGTGVGADPVPDILGFADIKHVAACIDHPVDAGLGRSELGVMQDGGAPKRQRSPFSADIFADRIPFVGERERRLLVVLGVFEVGIGPFFRNVHAFDEFPACGTRARPVRPSYERKSGARTGARAEIVRACRPRWRQWAGRGCTDSAELQSCDGI